MDEYFCPHCDAVLNDQPGFDPSCGTWTCTECGKLLMDDDVYDGETYEGVAWYCDNCGALLNRQSGFSDVYDEWMCTECYHRNGTTEDDIFESMDDYNAHKAEQEDDVAGFLGKLLGSVISGAIEGVASALIHDEDDSVAQDEENDKENDYSSSYESNASGDALNLECPNCCDALENQVGFEDDTLNWRCTQCGTKLIRSWYDADFEEDYTDDGEDYEDADDDEYSTPNTASTSSSNQSTSKSFTPIKLGKKELRRKRLKAFFFKRKKIEIGYDWFDLTHRNFSEVEALLHNRAFTNIQLVCQKDIYVNFPLTPGLVESVRINGNTIFNARNQFPYDVEIVITYHEKREIELPYSSRHYKKAQYSEVVGEFRELGFTEVCEKPIKDLTTGWLTKNGSVQSVTIAGKADFKKKEVYKYDEEIVIEYHAFKKDKRKHREANTKES